MTEYDFCIAWNWEYDADFVSLLETVCISRGISVLQITPDNLADSIQALAPSTRGLSFRAFFDRASDTDVRFIPVVEWARKNASYRINPHEHEVRSWNKAAMHHDFISSGICTPYTIIIPSFEEQPGLSPMDLSPLGEMFYIKPAHGGGGEGVIEKATSFDQVLVARQEFPTDMYLLQEHITPVLLGSRPAWFRVLYCAEKEYLSFWDPNTYIYNLINPYEEEKYSLTPLREITSAIARVCNLDIFSTEIALTQNGNFIVVDYVNDQIDMRLQSKAVDGVPDEIVQDVAERLTDQVIRNRNLRQLND